MVFDAAIVGAGPAGCSCALWLAEYGLRPLLVERRDAACSTLQGLDFPQEWLLGSQGRTLAEIGAGYRAHLDARADIDKRFNTTPRALSRLRNGSWHVEFDDGSAADARNLVFATGVSPLRPPTYFNTALMSDALLDAVSLTHRRASFVGCRMLLLGGGDNAAENALSLAAQGNSVTVSSRHALHAQRRFADRLAKCRAVHVRAAEPPPTLRRAHGGYLARWADDTEAHFDAVAVLFGYRANRELLGLLPDGAGPDDGVFLAGDVSEHQHPCVPCAVGEGAHVAWLVERRLAAWQVAGDHSIDRVDRVDDSH